MSDVRNINDLREVLLDGINKFRKGELDIHQAMALGKMSDSVLGTIKSQYEYAKFLKEAPMIPFMEESHLRQISDIADKEEERLIEGKVVNRLEIKPKGK